MASGPYSFIDIAVLEEVRARFAAGDALAILTIDLDEVIWANGPGAALLGYPDIDAVTGGSPGLSFAARRQISATPGFPRMGRDRSVLVRLASGMTSKAVQFLVSGITLPDGEPAVLLAVPGQKENDGSAARVIEGFGEAGYFAALLDDRAQIGAASDGFNRLGIAQETLSRLVAEVEYESDRLVKRMIPAGDGLIPAGIARLTDEPAVHLLVAVDEPAEAERGAAMPVAEAVPVPAEPEATDEPVADETEAAAPSDADLPERLEEDEAEAEDTAAVPEAAPAAPTGEAAPDDWYFDDVTPARTDLPTGPVRFVWRTDADGAFSALSDEFVAAVGKQAANVTGRSFADVAAELKLDPSGEIAGLLQRRDTWSGRSVLWPVAGTEMRAPVDLAALPVYSRDRVFEGFRGFGVVRMDELAADPDALGMQLMRRRKPVPAPAETPQQDAAPAPAQGDDPFNGEVPAIARADGPERRASDKVIRLAEHRPAAPADRRLSPGERSAFEEIRARLREDFAKKEAEQERAGEKTAAAPAEAESEAEGAQEQHEAADAWTKPASLLDVRPAEQAPPAVEQNDEQPTSDTAESGDADEADAAEEVTEEFYDEPHLAELDAAPAGDDEAETDETQAADAGQELPVVANDDEPPVEEAHAAADAPAPPQEESDFAPSAVAAEEGRASVDTDLIGGLPLPLLVHAGDELYFANREFLNLTGYASLDQIRREGGLDRLFADSGPDETTGPDGQKLRLRTLGGEEFPVDARLQSIRWQGRSALLLALNRVEPPAPVAAPAPSPATSPFIGIEEMERRVAEMRTIIDTATDGVVLIAKDGMIRNISRPAEALFGFDSETVEGKPFASLFAIESQRAARDYLNGLAENGVASVLNDGREVIGREAEGRFIPLFMTIGRLPGDNGYCAVVRDITQWKRAEEELTQARTQAERASSQKTEFLARVSHEIRTPLNAIIGFSELMMDEKFGPIGSDRYRDYLRDINRSGNHVLDLVNDLLDISKIEAGEQEMNYEAVSLNDTLGETVAVMQPQANRDRVIIRSSFASRLPEVVADLRSVRQIALNLLSNAIRYTQAGGQVIVSTAYETSGDVVMRVRDTGIGMSLSEIDQALKPFKQINALKRGRHDGTGLGLPLTKAMVEANRARFSISSTPGEGTMVEITFPSTRVLAD